MPSDSSKSGTTIIMQQQQIQQQQQNMTMTSYTQDDIQTIKARNPKKEFSKCELLKLLSYLEGELQARDVVIAVLKSEKMKNLVNVASSYPDKFKLNDPHAALFRDKLALTGNIASRQTSTIVAQSEHEMRSIAEQHLEALSEKIRQNRQIHHKLVNYLKATEEKHNKTFQELCEERQMHSGDKVAIGLQLENTNLLKKLSETEIVRDDLEKEMQELKTSMETDRNKHRQIVLFLMEERKQILMKYVEERKRSEDLAQILSEEKQRVDNIAEGLEEESKKSLRMESELEKQSQIHEQEKKIMIGNFAMEEKKVKDLEVELTRLRQENETLKKTPSGGSSMMSSVAKIIQPTATVTSVPVSGPTTGIARSISPGQCRAVESNNIPTGAGNVATIIRAHSVQAASSTNPPQPPIKKGQYPAGQRVPPPIPPNKPIIKSTVASAASNQSRISFIQSQASVPAHAIAAQNATLHKDDEQI